MKGNGIGSVVVDEAGGLCDGCVSLVRHGMAAVEVDDRQSAGATHHSRSSEGATSRLGFQQAMSKMKNVELDYAM